MRARVPLEYCLAGQPRTTESKVTRARNLNCFTADPSSPTRDRPLRALTASGQLDLV